MNADAALIQGAETEGSQRGEFLLVLGNRELYCVLLILIVQFALVFRLGYMAGQASPVSAAAKSRGNAPKISAAKAASGTPLPSLAPPTSSLPIAEFLLPPVVG